MLIVLVLYCKPLVSEKQAVPASPQQGASLIRGMACLDVKLDVDMVRSGARKQRAVLAKSRKVLFSKPFLHAAKVHLVRSFVRSYFVWNASVPPI